MLIIAKILRPKALLAYVFAVLTSLTIVNLVFIYAYGSATSLAYSLNGFDTGVVILRDGVKCVYTSHVPLSLSKSLNMLPDVDAQAVTLTPPCCLIIQ